MTLLEDLKADPFFASESDKPAITDQYSRWDYSVRPALSIIDQLSLSLVEPVPESSESKSRRRHPLTSSQAPISIEAIDVTISVGNRKWSQVWIGGIVEQSSASNVPVVVKLFLERAFPYQDKGVEQITGRSQAMAESWSYARMKHLQGKKDSTCQWVSEQIPFSPQGARCRGHWVYTR